MNSVEILSLILVGLILSSAFFSASETGMMAINRYRLRHLARKKNRSAKRVLSLLDRTDRLLGVILIGNTFANILASAIATVLAVRLFGDLGVVISTIILTLIILIFAEITPKTYAATSPQRVAFFVSLPLSLLLKIFRPVVWLANLIANGFLRLLRINVKRSAIDHLSHEELRTVLHEATSKSVFAYQGMMLGILDLANTSVDDIIVPRNEIIGIDLEDELATIIKQLQASEHTRLPVFRENINDVLGILHMRRAMNLFTENKISKDNLVSILEPVHYVPEGTTLNNQLINFRHEKSRIGLVVDEYGDVQGLITLEDILEEIVGEFTTNFSTSMRNIVKQKDGSYLVDGVINVRELNRSLTLQLPTSGPKTLSGLIIEHLEMIPEVAVGMRVDGYPIEVIETKDNMVKVARIWPSLRKTGEQTAK